MSKLFKNYFPVVVWMLVIFLLSSVEGSNQATDPSFLFYASRKGAHVFEYFVLAILFLRSFEVHKMTDREKVMSAIIFPLTYAVSDEVHQLFVLGRTGKLTDVGFDLFGIALAIVIWNVWWRKKMKK